MKIEKFRIKNYKSIIDSGDCYLTDSITILAGKNESGKSSILQALEDFNSDKNIREDAIPIGESALKPQIEVTFTISKDDLIYILENSEITVPENLEDSSITIIKTFPNFYSLSKESIDKLLLEDDKENKQELLVSKIETLTKNYSKVCKNVDISDTLKAIEQINVLLNSDTLKAIEQINVLLNQIEGNEIETSEEAKKEIIGFINGIKTLNTEITSLLNNVKIFVDSFVKDFMPYFIFYNTFEDKFPHTIPKTELKNNAWAKDLEKISNFSISTILNADESKKKKHKTEINIELQGKFKKYWTQDPINLEVDRNSNDVFFRIQENGEYYRPDQRSQGQQWHLAFYTKVGARAREDFQNIILIDEPGLFLHAKAQKDLLLSLEDHSEDAQVVFSTHSPYLIEADKLNRIRLIFKKDNKVGTKIYNKIHALSDKDTLTPILTAIGMDLSDGIQDIGKRKNIITEGPSDVFYLHAFKILNKIEDLNFIYGGGSGHMGNIGNILTWRGCQVIYLFDNDQGKKDGKKQLKKDRMIEEKSILTITDNKGEAIEDIFSKDDFKTYVLKDSSISYEGKNSEFLKKDKKDKVLLARLFLESVQNGAVKKLDKKTQDNINNIFTKINSLFN